MSREELLRSPEEALRAALEAAREAGADQAEASYAGTESHFARFASSRFTQVGATVEHALRVRVLSDGRLGEETCQTLELDAVRRGARDAVEAARRSPPLEVELGFPREAEAGEPEEAPAGPPELPDGLAASEVPAELGPAFERARERGAHCAGAIKVARRRVAVENTAGLSRRCGTGSWEAAVIAEADGFSGYDGATGSLSTDPALDAIVERAVECARRGRDPIDLDPGAYDVVLAPDAIAEIIEWMAIASFGAVSVLDGTSLLAGRRGEAVTGEQVTLLDEGSPAEAPFDAEGSARRSVTFLDRGVAGAPVTDRLTALRLGGGAASTGHAPPVWSGVRSPLPRRLVLRPGTATEEELIGAVDRGLYVTRLHYVNGLLDRRRATTTGMTRDGTFLIEGGRLTRGVKNLRFNESMLEAFTRLGGLGREPREVPTWWTDLGVISAPSVLIRGFHFTGRSR